MVFKTPTWSNEASDPWEMRHWMNPIIAPTYSPGKVSRSWHWKGELRQSLGDSPTWGDEAESPRGIKQLQFIQKVQREESCTQKKIQEDHTHACEETTQGRREVKLKGLVKSTVLQQSWEQCLSHSQTEEFIIHRELVRMLREVVLRCSCGDPRKYGLSSGE